MPKHSSRPWSLLAITVLGAGLRIASLNTRSFWLDETTAVRQASWSIPDMLAWMSDNVHPPLFHTLLHYWIWEFGRGEIAVRVFPLVWGIAAIPLTYWAAHTIYDRRAGLIAAALVAFAPFFVWYSQEARMYTMMLVFALVSIAALWRALASRRFRWWALYALATACGLMTQYFFAFLVLGQAVYVLFLYHGAESDRPERAGEHHRLRPWPSRVLHTPGVPAWLASIGVAALPLTWWLPQVLKHPDLLRGVSGAFNYGGTPPSFGVHFNELILMPVEWVFGFHPELAMRDLVAMWPLVITLVFVSASQARRPSRPTQFLLACGAGGVASIVLLGTWQPIVLEARYATAVGIALVLLLAHGFARLRPAVAASVAAILIVLAAGLWIDQSFDPTSIVKWDNREAMSIVQTGFHSGDTILLLPNFVTSIPEYYLSPSIYSNIRTIPSFDAKGQPRNTPAALGEDLTRKVGPSPRVWVVATWQDVPRIALDRQLTDAWLRSHGYRLVEDRQLRQIRVALYEATTTPHFFIPQTSGVTP